MKLEPNFVPGDAAHTVSWQSGCEGALQWGAVTLCMAFSHAFMLSVLQVLVLSCMQRMSSEGFFLASWRALVLHTCHCVANCCWGADFQGTE